MSATWIRTLALYAGLLLVTTVTRAQSLRQPLVFEPNLGQAPADVKWTGRGPGYQLFLTADGMTMVTQRSDAAVLHGSGGRVPPQRADDNVVKMKLYGSRPWNSITGLEPTGGVSNYLIGRDQSAWHTNIPQYKRIDAGSVYDGVNLVLYSHDGNLEYDLQLAPGVDPKNIRLAFEGQKRMRIDDASGDLVLTTNDGAEIRQVRPRIYQQIGPNRVDVAGSYTLLKHGRAGFTLANYDRSSPLVIDPLVAFIQRIPSQNAAGQAVALDSAGNSYITGWARSNDFPSVDAFESYHPCEASFLGFCNGFADAVVMKLAPTGDILFSTYYGGPNNDFGYAIAVDSTGVWVAGDRGGFAFVLKLSPNGAYVFDKLFGADEVDGGGGEPQTSTTNQAFGLALDSQHNAWMVGATNSPGYPQVNTSFKKSVDAAGDVFLTKFAPNGNVLFSRIIGNGPDAAYGVAIDGADDPLVTGRTCSTAFDQLAQPRGLNLGIGACKVFVFGLVGQNPDSALFYTTFGGSSNDGGYAIAVDKNYFAYVTGITTDANFPTTPGAFQTVAASSASQAFVTRLDSRAGMILTSTFLGNEAYSAGQAIALLDTGEAYPEVYVGGTTYSHNFPGGGPINSNPNTGFVSRFTGDLSFGGLHTLDYSLYYGTSVQGVAVQNAQPIALYTAGYIASVSGGPTELYLTKTFDDVGRNDLLWSNAATGGISAWLINSQGLVTGIQNLSSPCDSQANCSQVWSFVGNSDFNGDGLGDALWYSSSSGQLQIWLTDQFGANVGVQTLSSICGPADGCSTTWKPVGVGDFNKDGKADILWQNVKTGALRAWLMDGAGTVTGTLTLSLKTPWEIIGIGDFNHDGINDLFTYDPSTGKVDIAYLDGAGNVTGTQWLAKVCGPSDGCSATWKPAGMADVDNDTYSDLLWVNVSTGEVQAWLMNGTDRIKGITSLSERCTPSMGCTLGSVPLGALTDSHIAH